MDGAIYASVAQNLANGIGTFWAPIYQPSSIAPFISSAQRHFINQETARPIEFSIMCPTELMSIDRNILIPKALSH